MNAYAPTDTIITVIRKYVSFLIVILNMSSRSQIYSFERTRFMDPPLWETKQLRFPAYAADMTLVPVHQRQGRSRSLPVVVTEGEGR